MPVAGRSPDAGRRAPAAGADAIAAPATRAQRIALVVGLLVVAWLALELFASVLAPFVAAAVIAYALDPPTTRLTRLGVPRGIAALAMIIALLAAVAAVPAAALPDDRGADRPVPGPYPAIT